jgi:hypothetical protein
MSTQDFKVYLYLVSLVNLYSACMTARTGRTRVRQPTHRNIQTFVQGDGCRDFEQFLDKYRHRYSAVFRKAEIKLMESVLDAPSVP